MRALESLVLAVGRQPADVRDDLLRAALIAGIDTARAHTTPEAEPEPSSRCQSHAAEALRRRRRSVLGGR